MTSSVLFKDHKPVLQALLGHVDLQLMVYVTNSQTYHHVLTFLFTLLTARKQFVISGPKAQ